MKKVIFSSHALLRMEERGLDEGLIIEGISIPDKIEKSEVNPLRFLVKKLYFNQQFQAEHLLMIVIESKPNFLKVITVIDASKISKYF